MKQSRTRVAYKYTRALYEVAEERNELSSIFEEINVLKKIFNDNKRLVTALSGNKISLIEKQNLLNVLKKEFSNTIQDFLGLLSDYKRLDTLPIIIEDFIDLYDKKQGIVKATAVTTYKLKDSQINSLSESLKKKFNANEIDIENDIDESIMGGVIIRVGDQIIDGSIKQKLANVKKILLEN